MTSIKIRFGNWKISEKVQEIADAVHVRTRWVLCNNVDVEKPDMRARFVACKIDTTGEENALFASTFPGE